eukprot:CAMPEP_0202098838 /NCGR_PEP_ID=MMETSP0965-20130614/2100_1 /ASSEMBLY_ACC=CAM_ASM_000507 /TAXON_ID=4773 /ORGANISM="Schizochytrium aggregatum, Strain ATCC28209" /LENGTH=62 /DNA_ID=CAMNT_0048667339 /DNA_START=215 /DNA_END=400 /DNA_ORIENTATION=+
MRSPERGPQQSQPDLLPISSGDESGTTTQAHGHVASKGSRLRPSPAPLSFASRHRHLAAPPP